MSKNFKKAWAVINLLLLLGGTAISASDVVSWSYGATERQLRLGACIAPDVLAEHLPDLLISLENKGNKDITLDLGVVLGNGELYCPNALELIVIDRAGEVHYLSYGYPAAVSGRVDPFIVPLPAGSAYQLRYPLSRFLEEKAFRPAFSSYLSSTPFSFVKGKYKISVVIKPFLVTKENLSLDVAGLSLMHYWTGKITSGVVSCSIPWDAKPYLSY
jgi:hypothetical protein